MLIIVSLVVLAAGCESGWRTARYDAANTGYNPNEHTLTAANIGSLQVEYTATLSEMAGSWATPTLSLIHI